MNWINNIRSDPLRSNVNAKDGSLISIRATLKFNHYIFDILNILKLFYQIILGLLFEIGLSLIIFTYLS